MSPNRKDGPRQWQAPKQKSMQRSSGYPKRIIGIAKQEPGNSISNRQSCGKEALGIEEQWNRRAIKGNGIALHCGGMEKVGVELSG